MVKERASGSGGIKLVQRMNECIWGKGGAYRRLWRRTCCMVHLRILDIRTGHQ